MSREKSENYSTMSGPSPAKQTPSRRDACGAGAEVVTGEARPPRTAEAVVAEMRGVVECFRNYPPEAVVHYPVRNGDLVLLLAHIDTLRERAVDARNVLVNENRAIRTENDKLRALLAKGSGDCTYCGLSADDIAKCASGFPGCARMDDIVTTVETAELQEAQMKFAVAMSEADTLRAERDVAVAEREQFRHAVSLAVHFLEPYEPGDSRAVSNEFVAMAAISCGLEDANCYDVIDKALAEIAKKADK